MRSEAISPDRGPEAVWRIWYDTYTENYRLVYNMYNVDVDKRFDCPIEALDYVEGLYDKHMSVYEKVGQKR